jgi:hypothetical protein
VQRVREIPQEHLGRKLCVRRRRVLEITQTYTIHIHIHTYLCRSTSIQLLRLSSLRSHIQDACVGFITRKYCVKSSYCLRLQAESHFVLLWCRSRVVC